MPLTVSLNGADNVGKSTQIGLLPHHYSISVVGSLHDCDQKIGQMVKAGNMDKWWWSCSDEDFVCTIFGALGRRYWNSLINEQTAIAVYDRGTAMFEAVSVAVLAVKSEGNDLKEARAKLDRILQQQCLHVPREKLAILLKHGANLGESVEITLKREHKPTNERYRRYQTLLQTEIQFQEENGVYQHIIVAGEPDTHREVQDKIRGIIHSYTNDFPFTPMLRNLTRIYAFGGLSEAGKSSLAQSLCIHYGPTVAVRTKIAYFIDTASEKIGKSIYTLPEKEQALWLYHEIEKFSDRHYWFKFITIESLHRDTMTMWLKTWLRDTLQIIYVDTGDDRRFQRSLVPYDTVVSNDASKRERGADLIRERADLVLDNNGPFEVSVQSMTSFASELETKRDTINKAESGSMVVARS